MNSRVVTANRLRSPHAHLHSPAVLLRARFNIAGRIETEEILRAQLVLDLVANTAEIRDLVDVVDAAAGFGAELSESVPHVDLGRADADSDPVDRHARPPRIIERLIE